MITKSRHWEIAVLRRARTIREFAPAGVRSMCCKDEQPIQRLYGTETSSNNLGPMGFYLIQDPAYSAIAMEMIFLPRSNYEVQDGHATASWRETSLPQPTPRTVVSRDEVALKRTGSAPGKNDADSVGPDLRRSRSVP
ncbi:hypothetical protein IF1G_06703 [Cordyceps javanica]|uniref:Uncharacterized protein n=1 Tax=Cordyceps javanica TaxID=43265 RepID=A0A545UYZ2_9HYPO|nr:hypothetical protein IF1G_06703 [Cordyceps javanica]TQW06567.1 hypothetical protein IF2G_05989 [Cordyceps javanica]